MFEDVSSNVRDFSGPAVLTRFFADIALPLAFGPSVGDYLRYTGNGRPHGRSRAS